MNSSVSPPHRFHRLFFALPVIVLALTFGGYHVYQSMAWNRVLEPVKLTLAAASQEGLEYPDARPLDDATRARRDAPQFSVELQSSLEQLRTRFDQDETHSPEITYWLAAGLTATGELQTARAALDIGRVHHPYDQRLWNLDVILTRAEDDLDLAIERAETLIEMFPENELARKNRQSLGPAG